MSSKSRQILHCCECAGCQEHPYSRTAKLHRSINHVIAALDEKNRRRFAGVWASHLGWGGIQRLVEITGLSRPTIARGLRELKRERAKPKDRIRRAGAGRKRIEKKGPAF